MALFAALSYAVTSSSKGGGSGISKDKAKIYASQIVQYGTEVENAVSRLMLMERVPEYGLDFSDPSVNTENSSNTTCAVNTCKVFHLQGGGIAPLKLPKNALDLNFGSDLKLRVQMGQVLDVGSAEPDVLLVVYPLAEEVCHQINRKLNGQDAQTEWFGGFTPYQGALTSIPATTTTIGDDIAAYKGKHALCSTHTSGAYYLHVLIAR